MSRLAALATAVLVSACAVSIGNTNGTESAYASGTRGEILRVLDDQTAAWNRGDLEGFMAGYWRSPDLVFTSGGKVQRGWRTTLDRYRATYGGSTESMGRLSFHDVEVHSLGEDAAWVLGRWNLERTGGDLGGVFTLVFRRIDGDWKIVHDHTSVSPD